MNVKELMTDSPSACGINDSANDAVRIMWECDCGSVPVLDSEGHAIGIVTDRDICMAAYFTGRPLSAIPVTEIMSRDLCTVREDTDVSEAERLMQQRQVRRLPVVANGGCLVGILSLGDVALGVSGNGGARQSSREGQELLRTVTKVSEPRATVAQGS